MEHIWCLVSDLERTSAQADQRLSRLTSVEVGDSSWPCVGEGGGRGGEVECQTLERWGRTSGYWKPNSRQRIVRCADSMTSRWYGCRSSLKCCLPFLRLLLLLCLFPSGRCSFSPSLFWVVLPFHLFSPFVGGGGAFLQYTHTSRLLVCKKTKHFKEEGKRYHPKKEGKEEAAPRNTQQRKTAPPPKREG